MGYVVINRDFEREKPVVTAFGCIVTVFVFCPNKRIFNSIIESKVGGVDEVHNFRWKISVKILSMGAINGENIFNGKVKVMDVDDRNMITDRTLRAPIAEPKGRRA